MIDIRALTKRYGDTWALRGIDLQVPKGELCVLLGPSGCGKSTLLKLINGLLVPTGGEVFIDGRSSRDIPPAQLRRGIGYVVQSVGLFPHYTVARNIALVPGLLKWPREQIRRRSEELLDLIGLPAEFTDKYPHELSGGEAQRVGVARALAADPPILLMDEPFGSVDPLNRERLQRAFLSIQKTLKKTVVFVTHDVREAMLLGDRIVLMQEGKILREGRPIDYLRGPGDDFSRAFLGSDLALQLLGRYQAAEAAQLADSPPDDLPQVEGEASLARALAVMLTTGAEAVRVQGERPLLLTIAGLQRFFTGETADAP